MQIKSPAQWAAWKHSLLMIGLFALGIVAGRLILNDWPLMLTFAAIALALVLLLLSERRRGGTKPFPKGKQGGK